jgi:hypothetical protein
VGELTTGAALRARRPTRPSEASPMTLLVPVSWGELIDKITILEIKSERIAEPAKLANIRRELAALEAVRAAHLAADRLARVATATADLKAVNQRLWEIEDDIRLCEKAQDFGPRFISLARAVYMTNDHRAEIKRDISVLLGSDLVEEKSYA